MADKLLRFKDVYKEGHPLKFEEMHVTEYRPGEDELINYRAYRRKRAYGVGTGEGGPVGESYHPEKGTHRKGVTPGYDFKHKTITDPSDSKHKSKVHVIQGETKKDVDEALTFAQRLARKRSFRKFRAKVKRGREIAKRKILSREKLMKRTRRQVRLMIMKKLTKDIPKSELTYQRRAELEKRLEKPAMKKRMEVMVKRQFPKVYKAELAKKRKSRDPK